MAAPQQSSDLSAESPLQLTWRQRPLEPAGTAPLAALPCQTWSDAHPTPAVIPESICSIQKAIVLIYFIVLVVSE